LLQRTIDVRFGFKEADEAFDEMLTLAVAEGQVTIFTSQRRFFVASARLFLCFFPNRSRTKRIEAM
jgi:hypothetical protein